MMIESGNGNEYIYYMLSEEPDNSAISSREAGPTTTAMFEKVFGTSFSATDIYLQYQTYNGMIGGDYQITVGSNDWGEATYACYLTSDGTIKSVEKLTPKIRQTKNDTFDDVDDSLMDAAANDEKLSETARSLVNEKFADGRTIVETMIDGIQWDFGNPDNDVIANCKVHMSEGECYMVQMAYPSCEVIGFYVYPLGWHSCLWGYWNEDEAGEYPAPGETWETAGRH